MLGDDLISSDDRLLARMIAARERYGGSIIALMEVPSDQISLYGVAAFKPTDEPDIVAVTDLVEKPETSEAPSNWIVIGRYICDPAIFSVLRETPPGRGGEIQLTDALRTLAVADRDSCADGGGVHGVLFRGRRFDTGNKQDFLRTTVEFACARPDLAGDFVPWLREYLGKLK
jgi:UTP--glucose-1-phosphate uridylyltransferase